MELILIVQFYIRKHAFLEEHKFTFKCKECHAAASLKSQVTLSRHDVHQDYMENASRPVCVNVTYRPRGGPGASYVLLQERQRHPLHRTAGNSSRTAPMHDYCAVQGNPPTGVQEPYN